ncbi:MAG TPA: SRPBCC family protein [Lichenihabitans sp.]|jgi:uncharacterized protein YndB with AHSA1/START domain|nr:SRPBCC family protein [Lichenihabitans sp.]
MPDRIEKTIELAAPVERVWKALSDHHEFGTWFRVKIHDPFVPGEAATGRITHPGYEHVIWRARILEMEAPRLFSFSWHPYAVDPDHDYSEEVPTVVEFHLEPTAKGTRLTIIESGFDAVPEARRAEAFRMNEGGWTKQVENIKTHVER